MGDATGQRMSYGKGVATRGGIGSGSGEGGLIGLYPSCWTDSPPMVEEYGAKVQMALLMGTLKMAADRATIAAWTMACSVLSHHLRGMTRICVRIHVG